jgi:hypothetical protein
LLDHDFCELVVLLEEPNKLLEHKRLQHCGGVQCQIDVEDSEKECESVDQGLTRRTSG